MTLKTKRKKNVSESKRKRNYSKTKSFKNFINYLMLVIATLIILSVSDKQILGVLVVYTGVCFNLLILSRQATERKLTPLRAMVNSLIPLGILFICNLSKMIEISF